MKITVYEKPTCSTCRNLATLFRENGIDYEKVNYFIEPLTEDKISELARKAEMTPFQMLRPKEARELGITADTPDGEIVRMITESPQILQRPIVEVGDKAVMARPIEKALELIRENKD